VRTTAKVLQEVFGAIPRSRIALETGTHSPWISRLLSELGHEVIVAHARKVRLIGESRKKDDRLDAQTLARLARIDPQLLCPVKHRTTFLGDEREELFRNWRRSPLSTLLYSVQLLVEPQRR
jgi:transposase